MTGQHFERRCRVTEHEGGSIELIGPARYRERVLSDDQIEQAGRLLVQAAASPARVLVFGSYGRGDANDDSDLDFLVIEREVASRAAEAVRLRDVLPPLGVPVDVLVMSEEHAARRAQVAGSTVATALAEGRVIAAT